MLAAMMRRDTPGLGYDIDQKTLDVSCLPLRGFAADEHPYECSYLGCRQLLFLSELTMPRLSADGRKLDCHLGKQLS